MEQSPSPPPYLFIPKPIELQLAKYQLGTLLEVYKRGWAKHDNRRPKLQLLIVALGSLVVTIVSSIAIFDIVQSSHILVSSIVVIPTIAGMVFVACVYYLFQPSLCVAAFDEGLIYAKGTRVVVLHWAEIQSCEQKTIKKWYGLLYSLWLHSYDGRIIRVKAAYYQLVDLGKIIRKHIAK